MSDADLTQTKEADTSTARPTIGQAGSAVASADGPTIRAQTMRQVRALRALPVRPVPLGSPVGIYLPADGLTEARRQRFESGCSTLATHGFDVRLPSNLRRQQDGQAGSLAERLSALYGLANDDTIQVFMAGWGGTTTRDLLTGLDTARLVGGRRAWLGTSDAGVLLNYLTLKEHVVTFYGPSVVGKLDQSQHSDLRILTAPTGDVLVFGNESPKRWRVLYPGTAAGSLRGGDLRTLAGASASMDELVDPTGETVLFLESPEIGGETAERAMAMILQSNLGRSTKAVVLGDLGGNSTSTTKLIAAAAHEALRCPIFHCPTFGHGTFENPLIPIGAEVEVGRTAPTIPNERLVQ